MESISGSEAVMEGIGDEVLITFIIGGIALVLTLAWYSTDLTHLQTRLTADSVRVHRRNIVLNRRIGSSTSDSPVTQQATADTPSPEQNVSDEQAVTSDTVDSGNVDNVGPSTEDTAESGTPELSAGVASASPELPPLATLSPPTESSLDNENTEEKLKESSDITTDRESDQMPNSNENTSPAGQEESENSTAQPANESASNDVTETAHTADLDEIQIRIKFLNDDERVVRAKPSDTILYFKRCNFASELEEGKLVRIIFNGQVLRDDKTLQSCNVTENSIVHALVSDNAPTNQAHHVQTEVMFNAGVFMVPLFTTILGLFWFLRLQHPELFNLTSTMSLTCITGVFIFCLIAQMRSSQPQRANQNTHFGVNISAGNRLGSNG